MLNAHPFIISDFRAPTAIVTSGEYVLIVSQDNALFLFRSREMIAKYTANAPLRSASMGAFGAPVAAALCGERCALIFRNNRFDVQQIPAFVRAERCAVLSPSVVLLSDGRDAFYWDIARDSVDLAFRSCSAVRYVFSGCGRSYVLTADCCRCLAEGLPAVSLPMDISDSARAWCSQSFSSLFVLDGSTVHRIDASVDGSHFGDSVELPEDTCIDICCFSDDELIALFNRENRAQRYIRVYSYRKKEWSSSIDVPLVSSIHGCNNICFAGCSHYILILHRFPEVFDQIQANTPLHDIITCIDDDCSIGYLLILFFGIDSVYNEVLNLKSEKSNIIKFVIDELLNEGLDEMWCKLILKQPMYIGDKVSKVINYIQSSNHQIPSVIPLARALIKTGDHNSALQVLIKAKSITGILKLVPKLSDITPHLPSIIRTCSELLTTSKSENVKHLIYYLSNHVPPDSLIPLLTHDHDLFTVYFDCFDTAPASVATSYMRSVAIHRRPSLTRFIETHDTIDRCAASRSLLKLGCTSEYALVAAQSDPLQHLHYLLFAGRRDDALALIAVHRELIPHAIRALSSDSSDFLALVQRFDSLSLTPAQLIAAVPASAPAGALADGLALLSRICAAQRRTERLIRDICARDGASLFADFVAARTAPQRTQSPF